MMLTIFSEPQLHAPVLLCGVAGWSDAASAASGALKYLLLKRESQPVARFDPDQIYVYTITRPTVELVGGRQRLLRWPDFAFHVIRVPEGDHDLVLLVGPEPDVSWRAIATAAVGYARRLGVDRVITLGCFYAPVHYARRPLIVASTTDPSHDRVLRALGAQQSGYQGPTGFLSALIAEADAKQLVTTAIWTAAPSYLPNIENPKLASALLGVVEQLLGQELWRAELEAAGLDFERRIREAMRQRPDLAKNLDRLEPPEADQPAPAAELEPPAELPSKEEVLREVEEYLRRLRGQQSEGS